MGANLTYTGTSGWTEAVLPTITLSAASSIATTTAQLNGNITNLNGSGVGSTVSIYYGTSDGLKVPQVGLIQSVRLHLHNRKE